MRRIELAFCIFIFGAVWASAAWKSDNQVTIVDMGRLIKAYPETAESEAILRSQFDEFEDEKEALLKKHEEMRTKLEDLHKETGNSALSEEAREEKKKELEKGVAGLRDFEQQMREKLKLRQDQITDEKRRLQKRIFDKLKDMVEKYADKKGYTIVMDASAVIYRSDQVDITEDMIKIIQDKKD